MRGVGLLAMVAGWASTALAEPTAILNTLEWCPYTCEQQEDGGVTASIVRDAFRSMGYAVEFRFRPWQRTVREAQEQPDIAGFFPEYAEPLDGFTLSPVIGEGPVGLVVPAGLEVTDITPAGLAAMRIGIVSGYHNAAPLREAIAQGIADIDEASTDSINIRKVAARRIHAAEVDRNVFNWLMRQDPELQPIRGRVQFGPTLEVKTLHVAFNNRENGRKLAAVFAEGLKKVDVGAINARAFEQTARR